VAARSGPGGPVGEMRSNEEYDAIRGVPSQWGTVWRVGVPPSQENFRSTASRNGRIPVHFQTNLLAFIREGAKHRSDGGRGLKIEVGAQRPPPSSL